MRAPGSLPLLRGAPDRVQPVSGSADSRPSPAAGRASRAGASVVEVVGPGRFSDRELFVPLGRMSAAQELADRLLAAVAVGSYLPGDRFPSERSLAAAFAVSRATVREALRMLRAADVIEIRLGRSGGAYVREVQPGTADEAVRRTVADHGPELEQVFDLRELVESLVARTAAERRTAADVEKMQAALSAFRKASSDRAQHEADQALHDAVLRAAHNAQLGWLSHQLLVAASLGLPAEPYASDMYPRARSEHGSLVRAVVAGDGDRAATVARRHFRISAETVQRALAQTGSRDTDQASSNEDALAGGVAH